MTRLEIIHAVPDLRRSAGGIATVVPALASALTHEQIGGRFLTLKHDDDFAWRACTSLVTGGVFDLTRSVRKVVAEVTQGDRVNVVLHSHGLWHPMNHAFSRVAIELGLPLIISVHGMLLPWARQNRKLRKDIAWLAYQRRDLARADAVHVTSQAEHNIAAETIPMGRLETIPFGVTLPTAAQGMRRANARPRTLLFLGRIHPVKNLEGLIRAFDAARPQGWQLRIVGPDEGGYRVRLEALVRTLGARDRILFEDAVYGPEKEALIDDIDVLVLPSYTENFGAVVAEALARGRPVISARGTPWQRLEQMQCGWWVSPDVASLTKVIREMAGTPPDELAAMGARGQDLVRREFSWSNAASRMAAVYKAIVSTKNSDRNRAVA